MSTVPQFRPAQLVSSIAPANDRLDFTLPPALEACMPPEARGFARDQVRLMVSYRSGNRVLHRQFRQLGDFLNAGDLCPLSVNSTQRLR